MMSNKSEVTTVEKSQEQPCTENSTVTVTTVENSYEEECAENSTCHAVLPTGRYFGRKTQNWPNKILSGWKNLQPKFLQICLKLAENWQNFFEEFFLKSLDNLQA
jgi:hypothetical protein